MISKAARFLYLSQEDVIKAGALDMKVALNTIERFFYLYGKNEVVIPDKVVLRWGDYNSEREKGRINSMPAYVGGEFDMAGIKWIGSSPMNPQRYGFPRASALIILNDPETKLPVVVMDGTIVSMMRTGAASGVAAKYLAKSESQTLGIIGSGVQARSQLWAIKEAIPSIELLLVNDIAEERAKKLARESEKKYNVKAKAVSLKEIYEKADIIVTATTSTLPILKEPIHKPGVLYLQIGGYESTDTVIDSCDKIVVDDWEHILQRGIHTVAKMYQKGNFKKDRLYAELPEIVSGNKAGRENNKEKISFSSIGLGGEDVSLATVVYRNAIDKKLGQWLTLWEEPAFI